ncbi:hypothetical protein [Bacillus massiliigorillae]|uniref:hypothetical protein n=1 Tax=Bacillus massiliigorillae TaxID=1243664 RepID=UPI0003AA31AE|nr:hypothetical protein [Bacillus massiliigorillae]
MSRRVLGTTIAILGALATIINLSFFQHMEWYDKVRVISYAVFFIGIMLIPEYNKKKSKNQE